MTGNASAFLVSWNAILVGDLKGAPPTAVVCINTRCQCLTNMEVFDWPYSQFSQTFSVKFTLKLCALLMTQDSKINIYSLWWAHHICSPSSNNQQVSIFLFFVLSYHILTLAYSKYDMLICFMETLSSHLMWGLIIVKTWFNDTDCKLSQDTVDKTRFTFM